MDVATGNLLLTLTRPTPNPTAGGPKKCLKMLRLIVSPGWRRTERSRTSPELRSFMVGVMAVAFWHPNLSLRQTCFSGDHLSALNSHRIIFIFIFTLLARPSQPRPDPGEVFTTIKTARIGYQYLVVFFLVCTLTLSSAWLGPTFCLDNQNHTAGT